MSRPAGTVLGATQGAALPPQHVPVLVTDAPLAHLAFGTTHGTGPLVVLLHGIGGGREAWSDTGRALADAGWRALAVDLPGYGASAPAEPCTLAAMAAAVERLIVWAGAQDAIVVGHSLGGMVAQQLVATAPARVTQLVLAGTSPAFGAPGGDWQRAFVRARCEPLDAGLGMAGLAAQLTPSLAGPDALPARVAAAAALMAGVPEATYRAVLNALVQFDGRAQLARIAVPTLVIAGEHDRTAPPEVARRMAARIAGAELVLLPRTGHLLQLEQPEAFDAALLAFMERHRAPQAGRADRNEGITPPADRPQETAHHVRRA